MRKYYLHTRNNGIFYAELVNSETGTKMTAHSTGKRSPDEAIIVVAGWLNNGLPGLLMPTIKTLAEVDSFIKSMFGIMKNRRLLKTNWRTGSISVRGIVTSVCGV
jgi:hypothetical protein